MAFVDTATVFVQAGKGGSGVVSFRHERYIDKGGPDGGDGGDGGSVIFVADQNVDTLVDFRYQPRLIAEDGEAGAKAKRHGKTGQDLLVRVPLGTVVLEGETVLADLIEVGQKAVIAQGGKGGFGNAHFISSTRQVPRVAEKGEPGEAFELTLELKMVADVGLVGLPNAGKSTLLATISNARPEIADYPFTTLTPHLGVADFDGHSLLVADIPGLIEGAAEGKGLGDEFLRHVERTAVLAHLIDIYDDDLGNSYNTIEQELKRYSQELATRPRVIVLTKSEGFDDELLADRLQELKKLTKKRYPIFVISAQAKQGVAELLRALWELVQQQRAEEKPEEVSNPEGVRVIEAVPDNKELWHIKGPEGKRWFVSGSKIERFARRTDFENPHGIERLRDIMRKMGITRELQRRGAEPGQKVQIGRDPLQTIDL